MSFGFVLLIILMLAVLAVLFIGLGSMLTGGEFNKKYGNKLMQARVWLQALALLVFILLVAVS